MAMLAEKKRRTQWCLNPMGNFWTKDDNKFGQKMLEKMGWSPGTGLGVRGQGSTEIIKINVKNDTLGLGTKNDKGNEKWTKQLADFDSLLSELSGVPKEEEKEPIPLQSLEEKSKVSRVRVHYKKFTRGKDVSQYSSKDLNCILPLNQAKEEDKQELTENNMYTYFSKKANNPYKQHDNTSSGDISDKLEATLSDEAYDENSSSKKKRRKNIETQVEDDLANPLVKKKKRKTKESMDGNCSDSKETDKYVRNSNEEHEEEDSIDNDNQCTKLISKKKKKKRRKAEETEPKITDDYVRNSNEEHKEENSIDTNSQCDESVSKKKKRRKAKETDVDCPGPKETDDSVRKSKEEDSIGNDNQCTDIVSKKKKKKKKKRTQDEVNESVDTLL